MNPSLLRVEWQTHKDFGDESGKRVGNPIIIKSEADDPGPFPVLRCAGGGISSKRRSLK